jgi:hypothetical protein
MEFVTIHDLSRELNTPARVIRYRLIKLIAENKFKEFEDFRQDDFKDNQHFNWKIHPLRVMQETGLKRNPALTIDTKTDNQPPPVVNQPVNSPPQPDSKPSQIVTEPDTKGEGRSLAREMINILKEQIHVKDGQLREQGEQLKETHELNVKLTGTMLQQAQEIKNLLQLTGGKTDMSEVATKESRTGNNVVNDESSPVNESVSARYHTGNDGEPLKAA